ncbi:MAG: DUF262 domain-containing protein [Thermoflexibacteraceae bacterium]|jgi:uncharacterized protein with ParB-like and HNH nuclease domain
MKTIKEQQENNETLFSEFQQDITPVIVFNHDKVVRSDKNWTIETIISQIEQGNINLEPDFQRRKAWGDEKKVSLIESIILSYPIPEIVLAEDPNKKGTYIVIDGKQRLLTIMGFVNPQKYDYWEKPILQWEKDVLDKYPTNSIKKILNKKSFLDIQKDKELNRIFLNADMRCAVITHTPNTDVIYDMFYRLNAGAEPLTFQELRQALYRGKFSRFLINTTKTLQPLHTVMGLDKPDDRLIDVEMLLRLFAVRFRKDDYKGDLRKFLDDTMEYLNQNWEKLETEIEATYLALNTGIELLNEVFGNTREVGKLPPLYNQFNKALFEVEIYYFSQLPKEKITPNTQKAFKEEFVNIYRDSKYNDSVRLATNSTTSFANRFEVFGEIIKKVFKITIK